MYEGHREYVIYEIANVRVTTVIQRRAVLGVRLDGGLWLLEREARIGGARTAMSSHDWRTHSDSWKTIM